MGQFRARETSKGRVKRMEVEAKLSGKYPVIVIPKEIFKGFKTEFIKIKIENHVRTTYFWKVKDRKKTVISFRGLKLGRYLLTLEPYDLEKFLDEYNSLVEKKRDMKLLIKNDILITKIGNIAMQTKNWRFEREHGGGIYIIAEYSSIVSPKDKLELKYQLKHENAYLYIQQYSARKRRYTPYEVVDIDTSEVAIVLKYRHGNRMKATAIPLENLSDTTLRHIMIDPEDMEITKTQDIKTKELEIEGYRYRIKNPYISNELNVSMVTSFKLLNMKDALEESARQIRDKIGKHIASAFLRKKKFTKLLIDIENDEEFRRKFPSIKPDILAKKNDKYYVIEVKFRFKEKYIRNAFMRGLKEVKRQFNILRKYGTFEMDGESISVGGYGILVLGYDHRRKGGYLYFSIKEVIKK